MRVNLGGAWKKYKMLNNHTVKSRFLETISLETPFNFVNNIFLGFKTKSSPGPPLLEIKMGSKKDVWNFSEKIVGSQKRVKLFRK